MRDLFFISCTAGRKEDTRLYASLCQLGITGYQFFEHNRAGLSTCYNAALEQHAGSDRVLVLVHDDVTIADAFIREKLTAAVGMFDIVGLVGSAAFDPHAPATDFRWSLWPADHLSGAVEHVHASGFAFWSYFGPTPQRCVVLDGLFIAVDMLSVGHVRFDPQFAFHLYDMDFCLSAHAAGLVIGTTNVYAQHASQGDYGGNAYRTAFEDFRRKWAGQRPVDLLADEVPVRGAADEALARAAALYAADDLPAAAAACDAALAGAPGVAAHDLRGLIAHRQHDLAAAITSFRSAIDLDAHAPAPLIHLGHALLDLGFADQAGAALRRAYALAPLDPAVRAAVGDVAVADDLLRPAIAAARRDADDNPTDPLAAFRLANALQEARDTDGAIAAYRAAIALEPRYVAAINNLGMTLLEQGDVPQALGELRRAVALDPAVPTSHSNLLYALHFDPGITASALAEEHRVWAERHAAPAQATAAHHADHDSTPGRRLRIGYVSPNFRSHPVGRFIVPVLEAHTAAVQVFCYATSAREDGLTGRARAAVVRDGGEFVAAAGLTDRALAERITEDRIDILVDLTLHMAGGRLGVFARKPAPVQLCYLAYNSTTGVSAIDYRLSDRYLEPAAATLPFVERPAVLAEGYWCYDVRSAAAAAPAVNPLPALMRGHLTLACFNNIAKVSPAALGMWTRLLHALPTAHLLLHARPGSHRGRMLDDFASAGIAPSQIRFFDRLTLAQYFALHHAVDFALDPFPCAGGTTTCDGLYMGVPTVSLVGDLPIHRSGLSILTQVGLPELATFSEDAYLAAALGLAADLPRLAELRATLRERFLACPLTDAPRFAGHLEALYRTLWHKWCQRPPAH